MFSHIFHTCFHTHVFHTFSHPNMFSRIFTPTNIFRTCCNTFCHTSTFSHISQKNAQIPMKSLVRERTVLLPTTIFILKNAFLVSMTFHTLSIVGIEWNPSGLIVTKIFLLLTPPLVCPVLMVGMERATRLLPPGHFCCGYWQVMNMSERYW